MICLTAPQPQRAIPLPSARSGPSRYVFFSALARIWTTAHALAGNPATVSSGPDTATSSTTSDTLPPQKPPQHTRHTPNHDDGDDGDEDEHRGNHPNYAADPSPSTDPPLRKFACPYFKRSPHAHTELRASCSARGWPTVHRLKEHLYRSHTRPISCARCCKSFATEDALVLHSRDVVQCPIAEVPASLDGIDKFQERQLRSRKRTLRQTEAEKWAAVYRILFPTDDPDTIPSPYYLTGAEAELEKYNAYTKIELPRLLRQYLEGTFSANLDPALMLDQVSRGVLDSQAKLFESYRALHSTQHPLKIDPTRSPENRGISGPDMSPLISHSPPMINVRQSSAPSGSLSSDMTDRHLENVRPDPAGPSQSNPALLQVASTVDTQDLAMSRRHDSALGTPPSPAECTSKAIFSMDSKPF